VLHRGTVRIGVTGHRIVAEADKVMAGVDTALQRIERTFADGVLTVVSPLAEGADRLVVQRVLQRPQARLIAALPLPRTEYAKDFETTESLNEFRRLLNRADEVIELPAAPTRNEAYEAVGLYVLDHCDVLVAVWDGQGAQGQGGTGGIVALARARGRPIAWVHAGNRQPGTMEPTSLGAEQGTVTFENF
jgi:hypothetical protein